MSFPPMPGSPTSGPHPQLATFPRNDFNKIWTVTRTPMGTYLLSVPGGYGYTGVDFDAVIATTDESQSKEWVITRVKPSEDGESWHPTDRRTRIGPGLAWTADNTDPKEQSRIITRPICSPVTPDQLFQISYLED
ncbi:hypothetical protein BDP27DRAFT_1361781 [Rhodocollybia butyracea]|uniref:Uncharacterized protein n=1 Tax=Rhodocollybia butyracea TaxID=206335 RepID=A0A9P5Q026_9AGAR|nr:hypothetical protein BDP27DRAFT_1361781 [Rhodocollybia butyracea]